MVQLIIRLPQPCADKKGKGSPKTSKGRRGVASFYVCHFSVSRIVTVGLISSPSPFYIRRGQRYRNAIEVMPYSSKILSMAMNVDYVASANK